MTSSSDESEDIGISDDQLPEDLQPGEDNPLAGGLEPTETAGDLDPGELLDEGKPAEQDQDGEDNGDDHGDDHGDDPEAGKTDS